MERGAAVRRVNNLGGRARVEEGARDGRAVRVALAGAVASKVQRARALGVDGVDVDSEANELMHNVLCLVLRMCFCSSTKLS